MQETLYQLSLYRTALLIKNSFWNETCVTTEVTCNPFCGVPSNIVDDLVNFVLKISSSSGGTLEVTDLYHLLTSGRVENFKLDDILLNSEELISILMSLSVACQNLRSLSLKHVFFKDHYASLHETKAHMKKAALEVVLSLSPLLEIVESCVEFDLKALRNCDKLRVLNLHFPPKSSLFGFLEEIDGVLVAHNSLMVFTFLEDVRHVASEAQVATVLKHCPNLAQINSDISRSLELLHGSELFNGTLSAQYKLRKCCLGSVYVTRGSATLESVHIATHTCPLMEDVEILLSDNEVVYALTDFPNLSSLLIQWESPDGGDFQLGLQLLLEKIGPNLKCLNVVNFYNVDFAAIATKCPNIEELRVEFHQEYRGYEVPLECFKCLKTLQMENIETNYGCSESTLIMLLGNAVNLTKLRLCSAASLTDSVLVKVFQKNTLSKLKDVFLLDSSLTGEGVRILIENLSKLEFLHFSSSQVTFEEAAVIAHSINPMVIMTADFDQ